MVGDEDGEGEGLHHHHGRGRRDPAQKGEEGQGRAALPGHGEDVEVGGHLRVVQAAQEGQGQDGQVQEEEVEGEGPGGQGQVALVRVFHHGHVELPGEEEEGEEGEEGEAGPGQVAPEALGGKEEGVKAPADGLAEGLGPVPKEGVKAQGQHGEELHPPQRPRPGPGPGAAPWGPGGGCRRGW